MTNLFAEKCWPNKMRPPFRTYSILKYSSMDSIHTNGNIVKCSKKVLFVKTFIIIG